MSAFIKSTDMAGSMVSAFDWICSKLYASENIQFMWLPIQMRYLPFALLAIRLYFMASVDGTVCGFVVGHIVFYVLFVLPVVINRSVLKTPVILKRLFREMPPQAAS
jgi:hypothetical protein